MERLTTHICGHAHGAEGLRDDNLTGNYCRGEFEATAIVDRLAAIEDILGDDYDLDRLREAVEKQAEYEQFMEKWKQVAEIAGAVKKVGAERAAELVKADLDGRCVVLPCNLGDHIYRVIAGYIFKGIFFIEDAPRFGKTVFLTLEDAEAALKGD